MNGRQYLFSTKCLLEFVLGKYATPFQMKTKEKRLLQKQVSAKPNIGSKQYQHLLEKKTIGEEATTFRHELDFVEENERGNSSKCKDLTTHPYIKNLELKSVDKYVNCSNFQASLTSI